METMFSTLKILAFNLQWFLWGLDNGDDVPVAENGNDTVVADESGDISFPLLMLAMLGVFYFFMMRKSRTQKQRRADQMNALELYANVITIGGLCGTVVEIEETTDDKGNDVISHVTIETDSESQTRIRVIREAIGRIVSSEDETSAETQK